MNRNTVLLRVKILISLFILISLITMVHSSTAFGQILIGINSGINLSGAQDHKFKQYDQKNELISYFKTKDIDGVASFVINFQATDWGVIRSFGNLGVRLDYMNWSLTTAVDKFPTDISPPFTHIEQERSAFMATILGKIPLVDYAQFSSSQNQIFVFGGIGGGFVYSAVQHGLRKWGPGMQLLGGIYIPLRHNLCLQFEGRYFLAPDVDSVPNPGWYVDTSGTHTFLRFDPHLDTSFMGILMGIEWQYFKF